MKIRKKEKLLACWLALAIFSVLSSESGGSGREKSSDLWRLYQDKTVV